MKSADVLYCTEVQYSVVMGVLHVEVGTGTYAYRPTLSFTEHSSIVGYNVTAFMSKIVLNICSEGQKG